MDSLSTAALALLIVAGNSAVGAVASQNYIATTTALAIDGVPCGRVYSIEGGDPRARSVVVGNPTGTTLPKKQISGLRYEPITLELTLPMAQPIVDWVGDLCANRQTRRTLLLTKYNPSGQVAGNSLQANNSLLTEVRFPAFDAAIPDAARLTLVFTPESTQAVTTAAALGATTSKAATVTLENFKIQIGNLPTTHVTRIESLTIKQPVTENIVGSTKQVVQLVGPTEFSNLALTITFADIAAWNTWRDNFVVKGTNDDASETSGSLDLFAPDLTTTLLALQFSHVGIVRASPEKEVSAADAVGKFQAELYFEGMTIGIPPAKLAVLPMAPTPATMVPLPATPSAPTLTPVTTMAPPPVQAGAAASAGGAAAGGAAASSPNSAAAAGGAAAGGASASTAGSPAAGGAAAGAADSSGGSPASGSASASPGGAGAAGATGSSADSAAGGAAQAGAPSSGTTTSTPVATNPADQGARDLKDFPRPGGTVRKSFSSTRQKSYVQEIVAYTAKEMPDALEEFYTKNLTGAGWELSTRVENDNSIANTHQIVLTWINGLRSVTVTLAEAKAGGSDIGVNQTTKFAP